MVCCTAIFDFPPENIPKLITETHWYWVIATGLLMLIQLPLTLIKKPSRWRYFQITVLSIVLLISFFLMLHTKISPVILKAPFHHCVFCLLENHPFVLIATIIFCLGVYLNFSYGLIGMVSHRTNSAAIAEKLAPMASKFLILYLVSTIVFIINFLISLYAN